MSNGREIGTAAIAIGLGILGGMAVAALLSALFSPRCPICNKPIPQGVNPCPHCHAVLKWG
jgi:hypothetical protein